MQIEAVEQVIHSRTYRLLSPRVLKEEVIERPVRSGQVVIEPAICSICHADLRYYTGNRRPEALAKKLPMALIHEGIGKVVESKASELEAGRRVVIVPNLPGYLLDGIKPEECCPSCRNGAGDNYCFRGRFLGSGTDGIAQNRLVLPAACAIPIPDNVPDEIAVLSELCSVSHQALHRVKEQLKTARAAVFGDGPVGYLTAAMLHHLFGLSRERLQVFGAIPEKLSNFEFADCSLVTEHDFVSGKKVDVAVECTGGKFSSDAINQAIQILNPGGCLILMGVTEDLVPINTRDILEKGITVIGSSRSCVQDYIHVLAAMKDPFYQTTLRRLLPDQHVPVHSIDDFANAMENAAAHRDWKKTILHFNWQKSTE